MEGRAPRGGSAAALRRHCENANDGEERLVLELHRAGVVTEEQLYRLEVVWRVVLRGGAAMAAMAAQGRLERRSGWKKSRAEESRVEARRVGSDWREESRVGVLCFANCPRQWIVAMSSSRGRSGGGVGRATGETAAGGRGRVCHAASKRAARQWDGSLASTAVYGVGEA